MDAAKKSSFQKRGQVQKSEIQGTKPSLHNSQLLISSGIPAFDNILGGGVPVGSLVLINEDEYGTYSNCVLKYFLAEGIASNHSCLIASLNNEPSTMAANLPSLVKAEEYKENTSDTATKDQKMTIAWRYEFLKCDSSIALKHSYFGHYFDLSKPINEKAIETVNLKYWSGSTGASGEAFKNSLYWCLLKFIEEKLTKGNHLATQKASDRKIFRIALHQLNSPLWQHDGAKNDIYLYMFLYSLRALLRNAYSTCFITLPFTTCKMDIMEKCIHFCDVAIQLQSFAGTKYENEVPYKDYNGFFIIQKLAAINTMVPVNPGATNLAFKLKRKKFVIEEFNLPPESEDTSGREQDDSVALPCSSGISNSKYDF